MKTNEDVLADSLKIKVKILFDHHKHGKGLSKKEREVLKEIISRIIQQIYQLTSLHNQDPELRAILKDVEDINYEDIAKEEINDFKASMEALFKEQGLNVDLSAIDDTDSEVEMMNKVRDAIFAAKEAQEELENNFTEASKSKKEIEQETKQLKLEAIQKQSLSSIYKQLAKVLHPDLEQDPLQKIEKEKLMKELTSAYENKDLHTLLRLEMDWMDQADQKNEQTEDKLKTYNSILKEQIDTLENEIEMIAHNPRYFPLQKFLIEAKSLKDCMFILNVCNKEIKEDLEIAQEEITILNSKGSVKFLKKMINHWEKMMLCARICLYTTKF